MFCEHLVQISTFLSISPLWLLTGRDKLTDGNTVVRGSDEAKLLTTYRTLTPDKQNVVVTLIRMLSKPEEKGRVNDSKKV